MVRFKNRVSALDEQFARQLSKRLGILNQQNRGGSTLQSSRRRLWLFGNDFLADRGHVNPESRSLSRFAVDPDVPSALPHDAIDGGESQAGSFPDAFGRE